MPIGAKLQALFTEKGTNVNEVATITGISPNTIYSLIRRDSEKANIDDLYKVAHHLGVTLNYFIDSPDDPTSSTHGDTFSISEIDKIKKYRALDEHGTDMVDIVLDKEYARCMGLQRNNNITVKHRAVPFPLLPASAGTGDFLDDDNVEMLEIPATDEYRQVDFALRISGDSMEPTYHDGDIVLVRRQPSVELGEIGIFVVDSLGYIKEQGVNCLASHNRKYNDIFPSEDSDVRCYGKVIGKLPTSLK